MAVICFIWNAATTPSSAVLKQRSAKANAAVAFQRPTKASEDAVQSGRLIHLALPGVIPAEGGVPLQIDGVVVGGLGISGVRSFQDGQIAAAGAAALTED